MTLSKKLLNKLSNMDATYKKVSSGTYDPITDTVVGAINAEVPIKIYIDTPQYGDITSGLAQAGDAVILASPEELGLAVNSGDTIIADKTYTVKSNKAVYGKNGVIALHQIICKV